MFGKKCYEIPAECDNCNQKVIIKIPIGVTIKQYLNNKQGLCPICGCPINYEENKSG